MTTAIAQQTPPETPKTSSSTSASPPKLFRQIRELLVRGEPRGSRPGTVCAQLAHFAGLIGSVPPCVSPSCTRRWLAPPATRSASNGLKVCRHGGQFSAAARACPRQLEHYGKVKQLSGAPIAIACFDPVRPIVPAATKNFLQAHSPVHPKTYLEHVAGQVRPPIPLIRERLPARL